MFFILYAFPVANTALKCSLEQIQNVPDTLTHLPRLMIDVVTIALTTPVEYSINMLLYVIISYSLHFRMCRQNGARG